jgi:hypothetical protein
VIEIKRSIKKAPFPAPSAIINQHSRYKPDARRKIQGDIKMIKIISASVIACFMAASSFAVAAGEKAPVSDMDREMREQAPTKLDGSQGKTPQKMDDKYRDKAGPAKKKIVKSGLRKYMPISGMDKGWAEVQMPPVKIALGV